ncbi:hypothetical protein ACFQ0B_37780 [Nonomuraea thailandensis]
MALSRWISSRARRVSRWNAVRSPVLAVQSMAPWRWYWLRNSFWTAGARRCRWKSSSSRVTGWPSTAATRSGRASATPAPTTAARAVTMPAIRASARRDGPRPAGFAAAGFAAAGFAAVRFAAVRFTRSPRSPPGGR